MRLELKHPDHDFTIALEDGSSTVLCVENPIVMRALLSDLCAQEEGRDGLFVLSNEDTILPIEDNLGIIMDPLHPGLVTRKLATKVSNLFKEHLVSEENLEETYSIVSALTKYADDMVARFDYSINYEDITPAGLAKFLSVSVETYYEGYLEKLIEHMNLHHDILGISSFVLLNTSSVFSFDELTMLVKDCTSMTHNLVFMESHLPENRIEGTTYIIIDKDGCELF